MRNPILQFLPALALATVQIIANDIEPGKEYYDATKIPNPIVIDGNLSEWVGVPVLSDPKYAIPKGSGTKGTYVLFEEYNGGTWTGPDDQTSAVQVVWDAQNLYIGIVVTDDYHENSANSPWNGDSAQLMIANGKRTSQVALYNYALGGTENDLGETIVEHEAGPGGTTAIVSRDIVKKKTTYEIKMPAAALGLKTLTNGTQIGLGMAINDGDELTPGQKGWGGLGAHSIVFGKTPAQTALLTLSTNVPGADRLFFSAINPTFDTFSFRATDKGISIVNATSTKLVIDGQTLALTASPKSGEATDFTYKFPTPLSPGSDHTYLIEMKDTNGNTVTNAGVFKTIQYAYLTAADKVTVDTTKPGFVWNVHQNAAFTTADNVRPLSQLAGSLGENNADPTLQGIAIAAGVAGANSSMPIRFDIPTVINMDVQSGSYGNIQPDDQMPGVPGITGSMDGAAGEILTYIELPAGKHTMIVNSDDGFRTTAATVADVFQAQVAAEFIGARSPTDTTFIAYVQDAGIYAFRTVWQNSTGDGNIEWLSVKADGTKVLINDTANGGFKAYRARIGKGSPAIREATPGPGASVAFDTPIHLSIQDGDSAVDSASVKLSVDGVQVNATIAKKGDLTSIDYKPDAIWASGSQHTASVSFTAGGVTRNQPWQFTIANYALLTKSHQAVKVDTTKRGFKWSIFQNEANTSTSLANTELALAGQLNDSTGSTALENLADPSMTGPALAAGVKVGALYQFEIPTVINLSQIEGESNGYFTPDEQMPGIPGTTGMNDGIDAEAITFVELPAGTITMGVVSDDSFRVQAGYINNPADGLLLGEVDNATANTTFRFVVQDAGIYPIRTIWTEGGGGAHIELFTVKADGTRVLINDTDNGGYKSYRSGTAPAKPANFTIAAQITSGQIQITWTEASVVLQQSTDLKSWTDVQNATSPYRPTTAGTSAKFYRLRN